MRRFPGAVSAAPAISITRPGFVLKMTAESSKHNPTSPAVAFGVAKSAGQIELLAIDASGKVALRGWFREDVVLYMLSSRQKPVVIGIEAGAIASDWALSLTACGRTAVIISPRSSEETLRSPLQLHRAQQVCMDALRLTKAAVARWAMPARRHESQLLFCVVPRAYQSRSKWIGARMVIPANAHINKFADCNLSHLILRKLISTFSVLGRCVQVGGLHLAASRPLGSRSPLATAR